MFSRRMLHIKCRNGKYPLSNVQRYPVEDGQVAWEAIFENYEPVTYEAKSIKNKPWADPQIGDKFNPTWNSLDGNINRVSHMGNYIIVNGRPLNPWGRTGLNGRGLLGRWGPNHAADPIVTRWKLVDGKRVTHPSTKLPVLQFCAIQRRDCNEWAIPGGMIDPGEKVSQTLLREFMEEALDSLERTPEQVKNDKRLLEDFFKTGAEIYQGYVDDPRNTDNAWIETVAVNFHDNDGTSAGKFKLLAGDDAKNVRWMDVDKKVSLYASHSSFIKKVATLRSAHW